LEASSISHTDLPHDKMGHFLDNTAGE
jgi:hypothetical protein